MSSPSSPKIPSPTSPKMKAWKKKTMTWNNYSTGYDGNKKSMMNSGSGSPEKSTGGEVMHSNTKGSDVEIEEPSCKTCHTKFVSAPFEAINIMDNRIRDIDSMHRSSMLKAFWKYGYDIRVGRFTQNMCRRMVKPAL